MFILDMAKAHVQNVKQRLDELNTQKKNLEEEINKLYVYVQQCIEEINKEENRKTSK
jgi:prefoldin subunit 5